MKRHIIGLAGFIGSGKDTVGDILVDNYNFKKLSYADRLKDTIATMFDWDRDMIEGQTPHSRKWREKPDEFWTNELGYDVTPRSILQRVGTDCMRKGLDDQIWILFVKKELIENPNTNFVIPDIRFFNERELVRNMNGQVWRIKKGPDPEWINNAINDNRYDTDWMHEYHPDIHESEWRWIDHPTEFDKTIHNEGTIEDLAQQIQRQMIDKC